MSDPPHEFSIPTAKARNLMENLRLFISLPPIWGFFTCSILIYGPPIRSAGQLSLLKPAPGGRAAVKIVGKFYEDTNAVLTKFVNFSVRKYLNEWVKINFSAFQSPPLLGMRRKKLTRQF